MSDPVNPATGAAPTTAAPAATPPSAPVAAQPAAAAPAAAAPPAAPAQAAAATAPADAPKPADATPAKRVVNPHARIAAKAQAGQATSAASIADLGAKYTAAQATIEAQTAALRAEADAQLAALSESQRAAVAGYGSDPLSQLKAITLLRKAGALNAALPALANTAPVAAAPAATAVNDPDVAAYLAWKDAKAKGHDLLAARLRLANGPAIEAGARKQPS